MLNAGTALGPYRIEAPLGAGGMGEVYRATDTRLGRAVAVKVIVAELAGDPSRVRRFELEARAAGALNHPNVCTIFDIGSQDGTPFVVMELLEGESLRANLQGGALPAGRAVRLAAQAARGLAAAHGKGIVHRDLKPANLFVTRDGHLKILDFGLAKLTRPDEFASATGDADSITMTQPGAVMGSIGYMAPEQVRGEPADRRADIFALGAVLYEMLTGTRAFAGQTFPESAYRILNGEPPPLAAEPALQPGLREVVRHCLEKEPDARYQDAGDLAFHLESLAGTEPGAPPTAAGARRAGRSPRIMAGLVLAGAVTAAVLGLPLARHLLRTNAPDIAYRQLTVQRGQLGTARFAPDGQSVYFTAQWAGTGIDIYETRPGFPTSRALGIPGAELLDISPAGMMAVAVAVDSGGGLPTLAEVPLSGGQPRHLLEKVRSAAWLPDGTALAVARRADYRDRLELPPGNVLFDTPGRIVGLRVSPTGRWLGFVETLGTGDTRGSFVIVDRTGKIVARTEIWNVPRGLDWSPDGRELWFCASQDIGTTEMRALSPDGEQRVVTRFAGIVELRVIAADGRLLLTRLNGETRVRGRGAGAGGERDLQWFDYSVPTDISADGRWLVFAEQGVFGGLRYAVCLRGLDGSPPVKLGVGSPGPISPDGRWVATYNNDLPCRLILLPTGSGEPDTLPRGSIEKYGRRMWSPDGQGIAFVGWEEGRPPRTFRQDLRGGLPLPVTPEGITAALIAPEGGRLLVWSRQDRAFLVWPLDGGTPQPLAGRLPSEVPLQWAADGQAVYFARLGGNAVDVWRIELATGRRTPWRTFVAPDPAAVGIRHLQMTPDGRSYAYQFEINTAVLYLATGFE